MLCVFADSFGLPRLWSRIFPLVERRDKSGSPRHRLPHLRHELLPSQWATEPLNVPSVPTFFTFNSGLNLWHTAGELRRLSNERSTLSFSTLCCSSCFATCRDMAQQFQPSQQLCSQPSAWLSCCGEVKSRQTERLPRRGFSNRSR